MMRIPVTVWSDRSAVNKALIRDTEFEGCAVKSPLSSFRGVQALLLCEFETAFPGCARGFRQGAQRGDPLERAPGADDGQDKALSGPPVTHVDQEIELV